MHKIKPFEQPIYLTRPVLPDLQKVTEKLKKIWDSKWLTNNGNQHKQLEEKLSKFLKTPNLSLFNNGTTALIVACKALELSGEVITTPFTFPATPHSLTWCGITPIFCDIDPLTMNINADKIEKMITPKTTAILGVHVFGMPCDVCKIEGIAKKYDLKVIYDAAHAFGVEMNDKGIGNFGDISMFSFHSTKLFHTVEGGALSCKNSDLKAKVNLLKNFGIKNEEEVLLSGINGKMNEIQAAIGLTVLDYVEDEKQKRKTLSTIYIKNLQNIKGISFLKDNHDVKKNYHYFVIRINAEKFRFSRNEIYDRLRKYNVFARKYFYPLCSDYSHYKHLPSADSQNLPEAQKAAEEVLCLPLYGELDILDIEKICEIILCK